MQTRLVEFQQIEHQTLRGIETLPDGEIHQNLICLHGFERTGTTEKKFKKLADMLVEHHIATLRFDFSGCGLSDGDLASVTIEKQGTEFINALDTFTHDTECHSTNIIAHSLGACVLASKLKDVRERIDKIIFIAPALNQKDLLRYWFVHGSMKKSHPETQITWQNYRDFLKEDNFLADCARTDRITKMNMIRPAYFLQNQDRDFSNYFDGTDPHILHIHGTRDALVPQESLNVHFDHHLFIEGGDHDLERPDSFKQWTTAAVDFFIKDENTQK